jgi:hypothetical protein
MEKYGRQFQQVIVRDGEGISFFIVGMRQMEIEDKDVIGRDSRGDQASCGSASRA